MYLNEGWIDWPVTKSKPYPEPWQQTFLEAAQYLRKHGWCQGTWENRTGAVCAAGAIKRVTIGNTDLFEQCLKKAFEYSHSTSLSRWNDHPKRTEGEVINLLEGIAKY